MDLDNITKETLKIFKTKIINLPYFNKTNYLNNVKNLKFKIISNEDVKTVLYMVSINTILIPENNVNVRKLLHDLIHMASSDRSAITQMKYTMGYEIVDNKEKHGQALNEGLTQLLVCNAIDGNDFSNDIYPIETRIAKMLTYIFGKDIIYEHFFKANPKAFIKNMILITGNNSVINLIVKMDELLKIVKDKQTIAFNKDCKMLLFDIQKILVNMFVKMKDVNDLDYDDFIKMLITFNTNNLILRSLLTAEDIEIERYFIDKTK